MDLIRFLPIGFAAGVCSGIFGIGGGIVLIPLLITFFGFSQQAANGTSLVALLLPVGALGVIAYFRAGIVTVEHLKIGFTIAVGIFLGTYLGARFAILLSEHVLRRAFAIFLVIVAIRLWFLK